VEGMYVMLRADVQNRQLHIIPFTTAEVNLVEFRITLGDKPGSLAKCATFLGDKEINLLASESKTVKEGKEAEWIVVADISKCKDNVREICKTLVNEKYAKEAVCRSFH
jgi:hypothetical protein